MLCLFKVTQISGSHPLRGRSWPLLYEDAGCHPCQPEASWLTVLEDDKIGASRHLVLRKHQSLTVTCRFDMQYSLYWNI